MPTSLEELQRLIEETRKDVRGLEVKIDKIHRRLVVSSFYSLLKLLIIVVPLVLSIWYFQPQLRTIYQTGGQMFNLLQTFPLQQNGVVQPIKLDPETLRQLRAQYPEVFR
ncbi:MAG: hypothetical protein AAB490_04100 [Patescibacteria group bacterium]